MFCMKQKKKGQEKVSQEGTAFSLLTDPDVAFDDAAWLVWFAETPPSESILLRTSIILPVDSKK